jgi:hypothetical protein
MRWSDLIIDGVSSFFVLCCMILLVSIGDVEDTAGRRGGFGIVLYVGHHQLSTLLSTIEDYHSPTSQHVANVQNQSEYYSHHSTLYTEFHSLYRVPTRHANANHSSTHQCSDANQIIHHAAHNDRQFNSRHPILRAMLCYNIWTGPNRPVHQTLK